MFKAQKCHKLFAYQALYPSLIKKYKLIIGIKNVLCLFIFFIYKKTKTQTNIWTF